MRHSRTVTQQLFLPELKKISKEPAIITSPIVLLMLAACGGGGGDGGLSAGTVDLAVTGSDGDDNLAGDSADNILRGGAGNDRLDGRAGNDILDGGPGDRDVAEYTSDPSGIIGGLVTATVTDGWGDTDTLVNIERIYGSAFNDMITGDDGDDVIAGRAGDDILIGGQGEDRFYGGAGNDRLDGGASERDRAYYEYNPAAVVVNLTDGIAIDGWGDTDTLISIEYVRGTNYNDRVTGNHLHNQLEGEAGDDTLFGLGGNDRLYGYAGNDFIDGGAGNEDKVYYDESPKGVTVNLIDGRATDGWDNTDTLMNIEQVLGSDFDDIITGDENENELYGEDGNDELYGRGADDELYGEDGNDKLFGGDGDDWIRGGDGNDELYGGRGHNNLTGDDGIDRFVLDTTDGATSGRVRDFTTDSTNGADIIVFKLEGDLTENQITTYTDMITAGDDRTLTIGDLTISVEENSDGGTTNTYIRGTYDDGTNDVTNYTLLIAGINPDDLTASHFEFI